MAYDLYPLEILETKKHILSDAARLGWKVVFEHDPYKPMSSIGIKNNNFISL
jgi:hypothetical protein